MIPERRAAVAFPKTTALGPTTIVVSTPSIVDDGFFRQHMHLQRSSSSHARLFVVPHKTAPTDVRTANVYADKLARGRAIA